MSQRPFLSALLLTFTATATAQTTLTYVDVGQACCMTGDAQGNRYIAGRVSGPSGGLDIVIVKVDAANNVIYRYVFPGSGYQQPQAIAVDSSGDVFVAGYERSQDFPVINSISTQTPAQDAGFLSKLDPTGSSLLFSYVFPGESAVNAIALDAAGQVYITGYTNNVLFPVTPNALPTLGPRVNASAIPYYAFVTKFSNNGNSILYSTYLGNDSVVCNLDAKSCLQAAGETSGNTIAIASDGSIVVAGSTTSNNFPVTAGAFQQACKCQFNESTGFITSIKPRGDALNWSTFFGGTEAPSQYSSGDEVDYLALASDGSPVIAGFIASPDFPGSQPSLPQASLFISKLNPAGSGLIFSTPLNGVQADVISGLSLGPVGDPWLAGDNEPFLTSSATPQSREAKSALPPLLGPFLIHLTADGNQVLVNKTFPIQSSGTDLYLDRASNATLLGPIGSLIRLDLASKAPAIYALSNGALFLSFGRVAPLEIVTFYGEGFGVPAASAQVAFDGLPAPVLSADANRIEVVAPSRIAGKTSVRVIGTSGASAPVQLVVVPSDPSIFPAVLNQDGTVNSFANPATQGSVITFWVSGAGLLTPALPDGAIASSPLAIPVLPVSVTVYNKPSEILYAGAAPGQVAGLIQVNCRIPAIQLPSGPAGISFNVQIGSASGSGGVAIK